MILGRTLENWCASFPLIRELVALQETTWFNPGVAPVAQALGDTGLTSADVADASARLGRFAAYLRVAFPETEGSAGIIESDILPLTHLQPLLGERYGQSLNGALWLKRDSHLPISGSIKARGGIYEVLKHAEDLALAGGLIKLDDDYALLHSDKARAFFGQYKIAVGSTGNLGMSIGIMGAALGFQVTVHMSADARQWKKDKLRSHGVTVVEYESDYSVAVAQGRQQAESDPSCHFVDDENSVNLFLGYAVAGERLKQQFAAAQITVDAQHPLFVYLPCGVGGAPGGVAFGLKLAFGDAVHCIFAEPTHSPCMLLGVYTGMHDEVSVQDFGIDNVTAADGLAVGRASGFVGKAMQRMLDGFYTVSDEEMYSLLALMERSEGLRLEPSALAGVPGIARVLGEQQGYLARAGLSPQAMANATHLVWATGGNMVPAAEMDAYLAKGRELLG
ncbi:MULTISPECIES: D-serine ammonia-lyase [Pseudomonas]|uniref:D-serine ammonia-lyase n=1 Tax=Pseudomonas TaxID=286 RepID=UPI000BA28897|nr:MULTISPECIES: D-serine ammonia-lyase [Pseudomonas]MBP3364647.1 D-serine ammonia-lyase [Pseudomonas sp.]MBP3859372.1 D-serine ammonia-lyase [Pseudomonas sp.]NMY53933.1 D-serine ammonia-lyase [Pseudomonas sp. WS 5051]PAA39105.1 D-serine ammonia-lyase [Pseudomonas fragi]PAA41665.1 D-serine ammonia-lyase [Pseudomonas fragi]